MTPATILHTVHTEPTHIQSLDNEEISIQYKNTGQIYKRQTTAIDEQFVYHIVQAIDSDPPDPLTMKKLKIE